MVMVMVRVRLALISFMQRAFSYTYARLVGRGIMEGTENAKARQVSLPMTNHCNVHLALSLP